MLIEKHNLDNDIDACMEKLGTLGWEEFVAKYQTALLLFGESSDIRKVWLRLQSHTCELWVRNAGAKLKHMSKLGGKGDKTENSKISSNPNITSIKTNEENTATQQTIPSNYASWPISLQKMFYHVC
ncbi:hypothetical protein R6Q59_014891 [Mikania micrantha]